MYSTTAYLYQQVQKVLLVDTSGAYFDMRYEPVYAKKLTINKGVDNVLLFEFVNQDQKPVNITGSEFVFRLIDQSGTEILAAKTMEMLSATIGRAKVVLTPAETDGLAAQPASYSIERSAGCYHQAVYTTGAIGRGQIDILDTTFPEFVPSEVITIPDIYGPDLYPEVNWNNMGQNVALNTQYLPVVLPIRYSSQINTEGSDFHTFRLKMDHYTGNVIVQAADAYNGAWADISDCYSYYDESDTQVINIPGVYPLMRLSMNSWGGDPNSLRATAQAEVNELGQVTAINITNGGAGYVAPPLVTILGTGAGATAEATINGGMVASITVTNPGSGYAQTPPNNQAVVVEITTGFITEIAYR
jgi:hypothetical protein